MQMYNNGFPATYQPIAFPQPAQQYQQPMQNVPQSAQQNGFYQTNNNQQIQQPVNSFQSGNGLSQAQIIPQQQIQDGGFVLVQSEEEARRYPVVHGYSVTFKNEIEPYLYKKTVGYSLLDTPIFEKYRLVKEDPHIAQAEIPQNIQANNASEETQQPEIVTDSIKREEFSSLIERFDKLSDIVDVLQTNLNKVQDSFDVFSTKKPTFIKTKEEKEKGED